MNYNMEYYKLDGMKMLGKILVASAVTVSATASSAPFFVTAPPPVNIPVVEYKSPVWKCPDCSPEEKYVLEQLQDKTKISDRNALATILGNIKSESNFHANICEGGARVPYSDCHRGGYGLIQWTTEKRYLGLGSFAEKYGCNPSTLQCQTRYMINEDQFQKVLPEFEGRGFGVHQYMVAAYYWLGWGIKGNRETYAYNYTKKMVLV